MVFGELADPTLLMIAYHFPPDEAIGGARPYRFYKYARRYGCEPVVVTAAPQTAPDPNVHYVPDPFITAPRSVEWHYDRVVRRFAMPGEVGISWSRHVVSLCRSMIASATPDRPVVLYSTFPPVGAHLAALQAASGSTVRWIADFRDPYVTCRQRLNRVQRAVALRLERAIVSRADLIILNTDAALEEWKERYPAIAPKMRVIYNGFDPDGDLTAPAMPAGERKVWIHTGDMYSGRHAGPIVASVQRLLDSRRLPASSLQLRFVGECEESALVPRDVYASGVRDGWIEVIPSKVPYAVAARMAHQASALVLLQPHTRTQIPGKLFDYIRMGRPILAFIARNSPIEPILEKSGIPHVIVHPDDSPERIDAQLLEFHSFAPGPSKASRWFQQTFNGAEQTRALCALVDEVAGGKVLRTS